VPPQISPDKRASIQDFVSSLADFPLLIVVSERKITSEWPTIRADQLRRNIRKPADLIRRP